MPCIPVRRSSEPRAGCREPSAAAIDAERFLEWARCAPGQHPPRTAGCAPSGRSHGRGRAEAAPWDASWCGCVCARCTAEP